MPPPLPPPPTAAAGPLPVALADFLQSGVSITVAACGERQVPSIAKAVGCRVSADGRTVTLLLFSGPAEPVLRDLRRHPSVAVCFSRPSTHQTVQLKSPAVRLEDPAPDDRAVARRCLDRLTVDLLGLGFPPAMLETFFWHEGDPMVALSFEPGDAFAQTPGPGAGQALAR